MKPFNFFISVLFSFYLSSALASSLPAFELHSGDIILISFNCYECRVIESETNTPFSHSGVVLRGSSGELFVAQSLTQVRLSSVQDFLKNKTPHTQASVFRPYELENRKDFPELEKSMRDVFAKYFQGLSFDSQYSWNNFDENGRELLYCSEFVAKFLDHFLSTPSLLFPLSYEKNHDYWFSYFKGHIPEGEMGNSPAALSTDTRFHLVGTLD
jgi:hypothetical protein